MILIDPKGKSNSTLCELGLLVTVLLPSDGSWMLRCGRVALCARRSKYVTRVGVETWVHAQESRTGSNLIEEKLGNSSEGCRGVFDPLVHHHIDMVSR